MAMAAVHVVVATGTALNTPFFLMVNCFYYEKT